jgi:hypothetical protein
MLQSEGAKPSDGARRQLETTYVCGLGDQCCAVSLSGRFYCGYAAGTEEH